jgi:hypothetical protein
MIANYRQAETAHEAAGGTFFDRTARRIKDLRVLHVYPVRDGAYFTTKTGWTEEFKLMYITDEGEVTEIGSYPTVSAVRRAATKAQARAPR